MALGIDLQDPRSGGGEAFLEAQMPATRLRQPEPNIELSPAIGAIRPQLDRLTSVGGGQADKLCNRLRDTGVCTFVDDIHANARSIGRSIGTRCLELMSHL